MIKKLLSFYHFLLGYLGAFIYGFPSRNIFVLGVTGTKGKSTVVELINGGLEAAGLKTALSSSIRVKIGDASENNKTGNTMPGRFFLQRFLRKAADMDCQYALIEVTSEGVRQHRARFIDFDAAMITNLRLEHIESHGGFGNYRAAKGKFLRDVKKFSRKSPKYFFVNENDYNNVSYFMEAAGGNAILYGKSDYAVNLLGEFNKENAGAAAAFLKTVGVRENIIKKAFGDFTGVPGRLEFIQKFPFAVIVDYAHTPDSLEAVYKTLRERMGGNSSSKLICVFGSAGGGRDKWKRPKMGMIAAENCDEIILTDEDPYDENPEKILDEIFSGFSSSKFNPSINLGLTLNEVEQVKVPAPNGRRQNLGEPRPRAGGAPNEVERQNSKFYRILDRRQAIKKAISLARGNDTVIITGKGSEQVIHKARGVKEPWSDKKTVQALIGN